MNRNRYIVADEVTLLDTKILTFAYVWQCAVMCHQFSSLQNLNKGKRDEQEHPTSAMLLISAIQQRLKFEPLTNVHISQTTTNHTKHMGSHVAQHVASKTFTFHDTITRRAPPARALTDSVMYYGGCRNTNQTSFQDR